MKTKNLIHHLLLIVPVFFLLNQLSAQSYLPGGIIFSTQQEIDDFQINYPNCTVIDGDVIINGDDINNLNGLNSLTRINGALNIRLNDQLVSLQGLEGITLIGDYLRITFNDVLNDLDGLANLDSIGSYLYLQANPALSSIGGLGNLAQIGGSLSVINNDALTTLTGLENIAPSSITHLEISLNDALAECSVQSICDYLLNPNGIVSIYDNSVACNNPSEISNSCGYTIDCLPNGDYYFSSQSEIDNFENNFPGCTEIFGNVFIKGNDITNLNGLNSIVSISGDLMIGKQLNSNSNPSLTDLTGLENLNKIHGSLIITGNSGLINVSGLSSLDSIGGSLDISYNPELNNISGLNHLLFVTANIRVDGNDELESLTGLGSISSIGGDFKIGQNNNLTSLTGVQNLELIGGGLFVYDNYSLVDFSGLGGINKIGDDLNVSATGSLVDFSGLNNLNFIGGSLIVEWNSALDNFNGLENLDTIQENIRINYNSTLSSLSGLDNVNSVKNLEITSNENLTACSINSICNYLTGPAGTVDIHSNAPGCNNPSEIANTCGITLSCLPFGNYHLNTQEEIDDFFIHYPTCSELSGSLYIDGNNITNLAGLEGITSIEKNLFLCGNDSLKDLTGLNTLTSIGNDFFAGYYETCGNPMFQNFNGLNALTRIGGIFHTVHNDNLESFTGLENLQSVGGFNLVGCLSLSSLSGLESLDSIHGNLEISGTNVLNSLSSLSNLKQVDGWIEITYNNMLSSLNGLDYIEPNSIELLKISGNSQLATCHVNSICDYLADTNNFVIVSNNATGCNNREEIESECTLDIPETPIESGVIFYPNPASNIIRLEWKAGNPIQVREVNIYDLPGKRRLHKSGQVSEIDVSILSEGFYIIEIIGNGIQLREKICIRAAH